MGFTGVSFGERILGIFINYASISGTESEHVIFIYRLFHNLLITYNEFASVLPNSIEQPHQTNWLVKFGFSFFSLLCYVYYFFLGKHSFNNEWLHSLLKCQPTYFEKIFFFFWMKIFKRIKKFIDYIFFSVCFEGVK